MNCMDIITQIQMSGTFHGRAARVVNVMGRRENFANTTAMHDVAEFLGATVVATELAGTEDFELVSSSANDAAAGTGARTVQVCYIAQADGSIQCVTVTLNGLTAVPFVMKAKQILWMEVLTTGSGNTSAGNIICRLLTAGATHEQITAGGNRSLSARFMVPTGFLAFIPDWDTHAIRQSMDVRLRGTCTSLERTLITAYIFQDNANMPADSNGEHSLPFLRFPAGAKIKASAVAGATTGNPKLDVSFPVILIAG